MTIEVHGETRPQEGRTLTQNQDAWAHGLTPIPWAAVCDGAEAAAGVAKRALFLLDAAIRAMTLGQALDPAVWGRLAKQVDRALAGGAETTLVAAAILGDQLIGVICGDSRAYLVPLEGPTTVLSDQPSKLRLGSGEVSPVVFTTALSPRDVLLLVSDGVWAPLGLAGIDRATRAGLARPFHDMPGAVLDAAAKRGRADDMTVAVMRVMR